MKIQGILLAAGSARRFGANKLIQPLGDGTPMAVAAARNLVQVIPDTLAVVRPGDPLGELLSKTGLQIIPCATAHKGIGVSLANAIAASDAQAWVITLGDMPFIKTQTITNVVQALIEGARLAAPFYKNRRGHPLGIHSCFRQALLELTGDIGARAILSKQAPHTLQRLPVNDPGVLIDIDVREQLTQTQHGINLKETQ